MGKLIGELDSREGDLVIHGEKGERGRAGGGRVAGASGSGAASFCLSRAEGRCAKNISLRETVSRRSKLQRKAAPT